MLASCNPATLGGCGGIVIQENLKLYLPSSETNLTQNCSQTWLLEVSVEKEQGLVCQNAFSHGLFLVEKHVECRPYPTLPDLQCTWLC